MERYTSLFNDIATRIDGAIINKAYNKNLAFGLLKERFAIIKNIQININNNLIPE
jgi:hypothetical protein